MPIYLRNANQTKQKNFTIKEIPIKFGLTPPYNILPVDNEYFIDFTPFHINKSSYGILHFVITEDLTSYNHACTRYKLYINNVYHSEFLNGGGDNNSEQFIVCVSIPYIFSQGEQNITLKCETFTNDARTVAKPTTLTLSIFE